MDSECKSQLHERVPVIDFEGFDGPNREKIRREIAGACESWGFFQLCNHGLHQDLMRRVKDVSKEFFYLPEEEKMKVKVKPGVIQGWSHPSLAASASKLTANSTEYYHNLFKPLREDVVPLNPPTFGITWIEYAEQIQALAENVLALISESLNVPSDTLTKRMRGPTDSPYLANKVNYYPPRKDTVDPLGVPSHSDPTAITFLLADDEAGLEVKKDDKWMPINPIENAFIVNVGDQLEILSNGRFPSVDHRGLPSKNPEHERLSLAIFYSANMKCVVGPLEELLDESHPPLYSACTFEEYMAKFAARGLDGKTGIASRQIKQE
ncbi:protein MpDOXC15 [Marchantia polymorpha subsp. ruderalis]